ncbi:gamma-type small acid-soluble spore protein [Bacillus xiapuensis]|uniref:gamma-type small acid-soluble spore protein n=1 Tax=Bacillus xiapuensis TaxID=2014075 RepID=UPI000C246CE5|nr:gamma-type small acid-soluble spore protein [Bacillus xiapuensis]
MKNQPNNKQKTMAGTDVNHVKQQNAASAMGQNAQNAAFGTEFSSETDAQHVKQQNAESEARKNQASKNS